MKLTKEEIQTIGHFLEQKKIKYLDIRVELMDHLATEFEDESHFVLIKDYLDSKADFITDFSKKQQKAIHWSYQKQLWVQFAKFFYKPKFLLVLAGLGSLGYILFQLFSLKTFSLICFFTLLTLVAYPIFYQIKYSKAVKKVQSMQSLFTIASLPSVFLHFFYLFEEVLFDNMFLLLIYFSFSILLAFSAIIVIENDRKRVLGKYHQLVKEA